MSNVYVQQGDKIILQAALDEDVYGDVRLFKNNHTPAVTDTEADYQQADYTGYPGAVAPTWGAPFTNGAGKGEIDADPITYTRTAGATSNTIYGAYFLDSAGKLVYADKFPAPIVMASTGDTFDYTPKTTAVTE